MGHVLSKTILISQTIELIAEQYKLSIKEARDRFYESNVVEMLDDDETGLYGESSLYLLSLYEKYMENIFEIIGDNYSGSYKYTRYACRGIVIKEDKILLSYEIKKDFWMLPGGGRENNEENNECVIRELQEETGYVVITKKQTVVVIEYYENIRYVSFYFLCEIVGETSTHLTEEEIENKLERRWNPLKEALNIFSRNEEYRNIYEEKRGAYLREYTALKRMIENNDISLS